MQILWLPLFLVTSIHIITLLGLYFVPINRYGVIYTIIMYAFSGFGITVGYHRLWSHRTYSATWPWRLFWGLGGVASLQGSIRWWCRLHRLHHSFSDTEVDPYGPNKGFWYSHILWIFHGKDRKVELAKVNIADIEADPIARWISQNYTWFSLFMAFGLPMIIFQDKMQAYFYGGCLARLVTWHSTWFVNSLAHWLGDDEYANETSAKDHMLTALLTLGEGNHGFHHAFPTSYKNGVRWYHYDPTKWLIELGYYLGLCYDLNHPTENEIQKARYQVKEKKLDELGNAIKWPEPPEINITLEEYREAVSSGKAWLALNNTVYDVTEFAKRHPGGEALMMSMIGKDQETVESFMQSKHTHTKAARNLMETLSFAKIV